MPKKKKPRKFILDKPRSFFEVEEGRLVPEYNLSIPRGIWCNNGYFLSVKKAKKLRLWLNESIKFLEKK